MVFKNKNFNGMNLKDFIKFIINFDDVDKILKETSIYSTKGFIFERLFDIIIKFGFCDYFPNNKYVHIIGNANKSTELKILDNFEIYLETEKVHSGKSGGCSDITLKNIETDGYVFISSKCFTRVQEVKDYSIADIHSVILRNQHNNSYKNAEIYILVINKNEFLNKVKAADSNSDHITYRMDDKHILDLNDLNKFFKLFKEDILKNFDKDWNSIYFTNKISLNLRFHQELITNKTSELIKKKYKSFLWGCKCRSGKTYMVGGLIDKEYINKNKFNVLIITPAPTETISQFTNQLFYKFSNFNKFKIYEVDNIKKSKFIDDNNYNIFVLSKQYLQIHIYENNIFKNIIFDMIYFDENHFAGTTDLSQTILNTYTSKNTVRIYLTATFNKPLKQWNIPQECQLFWDIEDEQFCKSILKNQDNVKFLEEKHGKEYINNTIELYKNKGFSIVDIFTPYLNMPDLHLITNMFDKERYEKIKKVLNKQSEIGFCFDTLFTLNKNKTAFVYEDEVKTYLRYISGSFREQDGIENTIFSRINKICCDNDSRKPTTQLWFLPSNNINEISKSLEFLMNEDIILKKYDVLCINTKNNELAKDIKNLISVKEKEAKDKGKYGLILLAGNMLTLGITLEKCDVVILLNNSNTCDKVFQQMYRCMSESEGKKIGFVVDMNINRVVNTCINYTVHKQQKTINEKVAYIIKNKLINIDSDMLENKDINADIIIDKIMNIWKQDPINNFKNLLKNLDNDLEEFDNDTQKLINEKFTKLETKDIINTKIKFNENGQDLPSGKNRSKSCETSETSDTNDSEDEKTQITISFTKDVLPYVIPLSCILTIQDKNKDFVNMLNQIKENHELLKIFDEQCYIWWNRKGLIDIIKNIVEKFFDKNSNTYNISIQFKMSIESLIDKPKELLELIADCLKPKIKEKKEFGEVFTPMEFINNKMLKDIEEYWFKNKNENIWTNEKLTWYDPAVGMGNYPIAIYYKLMDGLKNKIPNEDKRKKHIIEKQLYMGELNKKNCFITKQIFNINNLYKLNLYQGNTLNIDLNKEFGISKFDFIIGNPPYNEELTNIGAKPLYNKFIEFNIDKCNLLSFIVPSRWFAGGKGLDKFRNMMINRNDIVYIKNYNDASCIFGNLVNIKGGVNYFLIDKDYNGLCEYNGKKVKFNSFDIILDSKYHDLVNKFKDKDMLTKIYLGRYYGIESNDKRLIDENKKDYLKCYVSQQKGFIKYIDKNEVKKDFSKYKVITTEASFASYSGFGNTFIGFPNEVYSGSYISFNVESKQQAKSLLSYIKCKLPNVMLSLRKISQHINESTCKWIPLVPLDREWTDDKVYKYFELSNEEINLIKEKKINSYFELN